MSFFFLPNRNGTVFVSLFKIVDDLISLVKYNWGGVVYEYLVGSLCSASIVLKKQLHRKHFHVVGCVYLLQVIHSNLLFQEFYVVVLFCVMNLLLSFKLIVLLYIIAMAFDHFLFVKRKGAAMKSKFPRLLRWIDYKVWRCVNK